MLEILPVQPKSEQEALCAVCGEKHLPDSLAYAALIDGNTVGVCQFSAEAGIGRIFSLASSSGDHKTILLLGRAVLAFFELQGVESVVFDGTSPDESVLNSIGFTKNSDGGYYLHLTDFFSTGNSPE